MNTIKSIRILVILLFLSNLSYLMADEIRTAINLLDKIFNPNSSKNPEEEMSMTEMIRYHGYPVEEYNIITKDGYILTVHRIRHGKQNNIRSSHGIPILILPGLVCSSESWFTNTPDKILPYLLAEKGYDIWLGNFRGNTLGRRHVSISPEFSTFWNFSLDEMAQYDVPDMVDFVLQNTGYTRLHCIAYSLGGTAAFATLSIKLEYNEKIASIHALAPTAQMDHAKSPLFVIGVKLIDLVTLVHEVFGDFEVLSYSFGGELLGRILCIWASPELCSNLYNLVENFDEEQFNWSRLPVFLHFYPAGGSFKTFLHLMQMAASHRLQYYDNGAKKNQEIYNKSIPPLYDVTKVRVPVALYWSEGDHIADAHDATFFIKTLKNLVLSYRIPFKKFNHDDFLSARDIIPLLYAKIIETVGNLSKRESKYIN